MIDIELQRARSAMAESVTLPIAMWLEALDELEALREKAEQQVPSDVFFICDAYESGFGHGVKNDGHNNGAIFGHKRHGEAYELGYAEGLKRSKRMQPKAEQQEPVAYAVKSQGSVFSLVSSVSVAEEIVSMLRNDCPDTTFFALYAAPVRTKDLTDDEIDRIACNVSHKEFARAVIAADRELNK